jgi:hypothetical protein
MNNLSTALLPVIFAFAAALAAGCADEKPLAAQPCPCSDGHVCCASGLCAPEANSCQATERILSALAAGSWNGYMENFTELPSGSDSITLEIAPGPDGAASGWVTFGTGTPPPPATDGERGYPPGHTLGLGGGSAFPLVVEGFRYPLREARWQDRRLRFSVATRELWNDWCKLQKSFPADDRNEVFACIPNNGFSWGEQCKVGDVPIDCGKLALCMFGRGVCSCDAAGCQSDMSSFRLMFDVALDGTSGMGSGSVAGFSQFHNVRLIGRR